MYFYQVGGLNSHTYHWFRYDTGALAECVFSALSAQTNADADEKKNEIELVLGIMDTGASYLLVTDSQMKTIIRFRNLARPWAPHHASHYASLSPITFRSSAELYAKLKTYDQNARKKKSGRAQGQDTSPANKMFNQYNPARAFFEHQRVLWYATQSPIDINKFGLCELPTWIASTSFVSLTTEIWQKESIEKRKKDPTILSLELASVTCIAFERDDYASKISHSIRVKIKEHSFIANGPSVPRNDTSLEVVKAAELGRRLNDFFAAIDSKQALLLVYDAEQTLSSLKKLGVDVSQYRTGIGTLLYGQGPKQEEEKEVPPHSSTWGAKPFFAEEHRARSRSPKRHSSYPRRFRSPSSVRNTDSKPYNAVKKEEEPEDGDEVEDGEEADSSPTQVYVIDVLSLFLAVSRFAPGGVKSLHDLVARLEIAKDCNENESHLLIEAWRSMASGKAIDEQHTERSSSRAFAAAPLRVESSNTGLADHDSDEEFDPNDIVVDRNRPQHPLPVFSGGLRPPTDDYDSDDSDY
ncbi:hypothetical protein ACEPAH_4496 [Sanghuangporus vaninii]